MTIIYSVNDVINGTSARSDPLFRDFVVATARVEQQRLFDIIGGDLNKRVTWDDNGQYQGLLQVGAMAGVDAGIRNNRSSLQSQIAYLEWFWPRARTKARTVGELYYLHNQGLYADLAKRKVVGRQSNAAMALISS